MFEQNDGTSLVMKNEVIDQYDMTKYIGQWVGQVYHGRGTLIWQDGARYDGYFYKGQ